jgi:hypothetical protein
MRGQNVIQRYAGNDVPVVFAYIATGSAVGGRSDRWSSKFTRLAFGTLPKYNCGIGCMAKCHHVVDIVGKMFAGQLPGWHQRSGLIWNELKQSICLVWVNNGISL